MKAYFDQNYNGEPYDALARRKGKSLWLIQPGGKIVAPPPKKTSTSGQQQPTRPAASSGSVASASAPR
jgi:hypothetical protein